MSANEYGHVLNRPSHRAHVLVLILMTALLASLGVAQPAAAATRLQLSVGVNTTEFYPGQSVVTYGYLKSSSGKPLGSKTVYVQRLTGSTWKSIATTKTTATGHYRLYIREPGGFQLRTYAKAYNGDAGVVSKTIALTRISGTQTLEQRYEQLKPWLKEPIASTKTGTSYGVPIRWRSYANGALVEGGGRVYVVTGAVLKGYLSTGGTTGKLGRPISDADCYMTTDKCIQPFARGAVYYNAQSVTARKTHIAYGTGVGAEIVAAAMSQVGYREPAWQTNKYTAWNGLKTAWCGVFQSYNSAATKNGEAIPQVNTFEKLVAEVKRRGVTNTPRVGALIFIDFGSGNVTHTGIVTKVYSDGSMQTIEGNTVSPSDSVRQVAIKTRSPWQAEFFYIPGT
ncbi:CHAP domain-containing protein [Lysobacter korlensis]|uniref:CHAP domain-containing protein n=1 Tax=Lysobacter korlensis TaxID=553636 RepID=A0ABV6RYK9_9GAMM